MRERDRKVIKAKEVIFAVTRQSSHYVTKIVIKNNSSYLLIYLKF